VVLRRVYHHLSDPAATNVDLLRALRPGGVLAIIGFPPMFSWLWPWSPKDIPGNRTGALRHLSAFYTDDMAVLSPARLTAEPLRAAVRVARSGAEVRDRIDAAGRGAKLLVYVLPDTWRIADLPLDPATDRGHHVPIDFDPARYRVLFTRVRSHDPDAHGAAIVKTAYGREPIIVVRVNTQTGVITGIETPPPHVLWGDISTPLF